MSNYSELKSILTDSNFERDMRLVRLQGFRGNEADQAVAAGIGGRLAPALCGLGACLGVVLASPLLLGVLAVSAVIGVIAPNHPIEMVYNSVARRRGTAEVLPNTAGRRLGCFLGSLFLGGSTLAYVSGADLIGAILGLSLGLLAVFVAATNICVPSIMFTLIRGTQRTQFRSFFPAFFGSKSEERDSAADFAVD